MIYTIISFAALCQAQEARVGSGPVPAPQLQPSTDSAVPEPDVGTDDMEMKMPEPDSAVEPCINPREGWSVWNKCGCQNGTSNPCTETQNEETVMCMVDAECKPSEICGDVSKICEHNDNKIITAMEVETIDGGRRSKETWKDESYIEEVAMDNGGFTRTIFDKDGNKISQSSNGPAPPSLEETQNEETRMCMVDAECESNQICGDVSKICEPNDDVVNTAMEVETIEGGKKSKETWKDDSYIEEVAMDNGEFRRTIFDKDGNSIMVSSTGAAPPSLQETGAGVYPTPDDAEVYPTPDDAGAYPTPVADDQSLLQPQTEAEVYPTPDLTPEAEAYPTPDFTPPMSDFALDAINQAGWESIDLKRHEADEYERFFVVEGAHRCALQNGGLPRSTIVKLEDQTVEKGNCHHICAAQMNGLELCYGYSQNELGDCEFYHEPVATFGSGPNDDDFMGQGCYVKGISCGGHTAINCEHCPTPHSEHPETECNGQCIYDYEHMVDEKKVLGACRGLKEEETPETLVSCGAHMASSCMACVERFTYNCEEGYRYCNDDCSWEAGDCGFCPTTTSSTTTTEAPTTTTLPPTEGTTTEAPEKEGTGDDNASQGFNAAGAADLLR